MSRIVGDSLVGGPDTEYAPEYVTVRVSRGQAEALAASAEHVRDILSGDEGANYVAFLSRAIDALRAQIGGAR